VSEQEFEAYLRLLGRFLRLSDAQRQAVGRELRAHMEDRLEELMSKGYRREEAVEAVLDEFGDAAALASDFGRIGSRRKWVMRTTAGMVATACLVLLVSFLLPENRRLPAPSPSRAQEIVAVPPTTAPATVASSHQQVVVKATPSLETPADRETRSRLQATVPAFEFESGTGLEDVINFLRQKGQFSIDVNWNALAAVNIDKTTDIGGLSLQKVKLETALQILLDNVGGTETRLGYDVVDGVVRVSVPGDLDRRTVVRVYDVRALLNEPFSAQEQAVIDRMVAALASDSTPNPAGMGGYGPGGSGSQFPPADGSENKPVLVRQVIEQLTSSRSDGLLSALKAAVAPDTWKSDNGVGSTEIWNGRLVVRHTPRVHRELEAFLQLLAETNPSAGTQPAAELAARR
jgi:hypothetical protein